MRTKAAIAMAALCSLCRPSLAQPTYQTIDVPGATLTQITAINDAGVIAGSFELNGMHSFIRAADGTITTFDPPGSTNDAARGINAAGDTVGVFGAQSDTPRCFIRSAAGVFTTFGPLKGRLNACYVTTINDAGYVAGQGEHGLPHHSNFFGFIRSPSGPVQQFLSSNIYGTAVPPDGLNNAGVVVGTTLNGSQLVGFVRAKDGTVTTFSVPGAANTQASGINDQGVIIGTIEPTGPQAFVRSPDGTFTLFAVSGAGQTLPYAINAKGDVTGSYYSRKSMARGFVRSAKGELKTFTVAGAAYTEAFDINASGVIVGLYQYPNGEPHGFIRTP